LASEASFEYPEGFEAPVFACLAAREEFPCREWQRVWVMAMRCRAAF
jgi:hypothetical protein